MLIRINQKYDLHAQGSPVLQCTSKLRTMIFISFDFTDCREQAQIDLTIPPTGELDFFFVPKGPLVKRSPGLQSKLLPGNHRYKDTYASSKKSKCWFGYFISKLIWKGTPKSIGTAKESFDVDITQSQIGEVVCSALCKALIKAYFNNRHIPGHQHHPRDRHLF
jgi:hypothetical protein